MSLAQSQGKVFLRIVNGLRPHWRRDRSLPARLQKIFADNRSFGSRDRKLYRELVYTTLRFLPWVEVDLEQDAPTALRHIAWLAAETTATHAFRTELCRGMPAVPETVAGKSAVLKKDPTALLPEWVARHCAEAAVAPNLDFIHRRAPLWIRTRGGSGENWVREFSEKQIPWERSVASPSAVRILADFDLTRTDAFAAGEFEIQDIGSQLILESVAPAADGSWLDACAGAGGKTLQLAEKVREVDAFDVRPAALAELEIRRVRHRLGNIHPLSALPEKLYDGVLIDAPCSGSGTWRRSPHLKWFTSAGDVSQASAEQGQLLANYSRFVRPGGKLVYATCSLSRVENEGVISHFLRDFPGFSPEAVGSKIAATPREVGWAFLPATHDSDGFYFAVLQRGEK